MAAPVISIPHIDSHTVKKFSWSGDSPAIIQEVNLSKCKTYLVACRETREAILVDPEDVSVETYLSVITYHGLKLRFVADTHTHADHVSGVLKIARLTGATSLMHELAPVPEIDVHVRDEHVITLGKLTVTVVHTPGHTPDSISFVVNDFAVLSGDTLLIHGSGRCDFAGGDAGESYDSIFRLLNRLPDTAIVFPGHDYHGRESSTVASEKAQNTRIVGRTREEYVEMMGKLFSPHNLPDRIHYALQANQSGLLAHRVDRVKFPSLNDVHKVPQVSAVELLQTLVHDDARPILVDVREDKELETEGYIRGIHHVPLSSVQHAVQAKEGPFGVADRENRHFVIVCRAGSRSNTAAAILRTSGFTSVSNLTGGMVMWSENGFPVDLKVPDVPVTSGIL